MSRRNFETALRAATPTSRVAFLLMLCAFAAACTSSEERQAKKNADVKSELARETQRVCALPVGERQSEIDKALRDLGLVIVCR